jgi:hypothetical protein
MSATKLSMRLISKVRFSPWGGCWEWTGSKVAGYGQVWIGGKTRRAHRVAYYLHTGESPEVVCHSCDNPSCVNPHHLFGGTQADNVQDREQKGRGVRPNIRKTHCAQGHPFSGENTYTDKRGWRHCRECQRRWDQRRYHAPK